jgi:antitoxin (DNA-binding transcriptional repressor) of toxin-antitoxin stability system
MRVITIEELEANLSEILELVRTQEEEIIIEYKDKKIAKIVPCKEEKKKEFNPEEFFGITNFGKEKIDEYLKEIRDC